MDNVFVINRDSWHYKLNLKITNSEWQFNHWLEKEASFCSYFWVTTFKLFVVFVMVSIILGFVGIVGYNAYLAGLSSTLSAIGFMVFWIIAFVGFIIVFFFVTEGWSAAVTKITSTPAVSDSFFMTKYKSFKQRYCPAIELEKE